MLLVNSEDPTFCIQGQEIHSGVSLINALYVGVN